MYLAFIQIDLTALGLTLLFAFGFWLLWNWAQRRPQPLIQFSNLEPLLQTPNWRQKTFTLPNLLAFSSLALFLLAFLDPHFMQEKKTAESRLQGPPTKGVAIYLDVDQSGSMMEEITGVTSDGRRAQMTKLDLLKEVTKQFIQERPSDLIGLVSFARTAFVEVPLTLDHDFLLQEMTKLKPLIDPQDSGTAIGYAVFKTVSLIVGTRNYAKDLIGKGKPAYEIKNAIIVLITDGFQNINPEDRDKRLRTIDVREAAKYAKENDVRLYVVNVDPNIMAPEFKPHRHVMKSVTELTGGRFFVVDGSNSLTQIYHDIDRLEKSLLPTDKEVKPPTSYQRVSLYPYLIALGMLALFLSILLRSTLLRSFP